MMIDLPKKQNLGLNVRIETTLSISPFKDILMESQREVETDRIGRDDDLIFY